MSSLLRFLGFHNQKSSPKSSPDDAEIPLNQFPSDIFLLPVPSTVSNELNLARLPSDVIRILIKMEGDKIDTLRLVSILTF